MATHHAATCGSAARAHIEVAGARLGQATSTYTANSWYAVAYTGPANPGSSGMNYYNGYVAMCSIDPGGNFVG